jgi:putative ABC transport system permease protein
VPLRGADWTRTINAANAPGNPIDVAYDSVSPEFADFLGLSVREGRDFTWSDDTAGPRVAIVSESLATRIAPGRSAVGEYINFGPTPAGQHIQIVGVVKDFKFYDAKKGSPLVLLMPLLQNPEGTLASVLLRGPVSVAGLRQAVSSLGHEYVWRTQSIDEIVQASATLERFAAIAGSLFGGVAISLAALGLYGLLTYAVLRRTREFAIRAALGGRARAMVVLVLKQGFTIATVGAAIGVVVAAANVRWLQSLLFGVTVRDALSLSIVPVALAIVAVAACTVPAVRAAHIDPLILMREE